ncbi:MAG: CHAT domain-containing protein [Solidesulfovibrio sp. DCME]|uniref:CHAT domain-containing tetratricopeptide repeat protein n=1 Tax=Solidesulfovibrio sp. DCME TaxID=3447380 RepID=UPI003D10680A
MPEHARGGLTARRRWPYVLLWAGLLALSPGLEPAARAGLFQVAPWKVTREEPADGSPRFCRATAPMAGTVGSVSLYHLSLDAFADGEVRLQQRGEHDPDWMAYGKSEASGRKAVPGCRFWFDDRAMHPMTTILDYDAGVMRFDLCGDRQFLEELAASRYLKLETEPGSVTEVNGERRASSEGWTGYALSNTPSLVRQLQTCLASINDPTPVGPVTVYETAPPAAPGPAPLPGRLEAARRACRNTPDDNAEARAMASLQLGQAAADALRLGEAREAFAGLGATLSRGVAMTPSIRRGLARAVEVLIMAERYDEAFDVAKALPENEGLLATIDVARGDYAAAKKWLFAAAARIQGLPVATWGELTWQRANQYRMELLGAVAPGMRRLLLSLAMAALGQETATVRRHCGNCVYFMTESFPAVTAAATILDWTEGDMLREGAADTAAARRELGLAAFLRGDSLLRAGYLVTVKSELVYALFELDGQPGMEGWAARVRVSLARLTAAQGRASEALGEAQAAAAAAEAALGRESLPWIEAAALQSEAAQRVGNQAAAIAVAREGLAAASVCLPPQHSLVYRLNRCLGLALLQAGDAAAAERVLASALGLQGLPDIPDKRLRETVRRLDALPQPVLSKPIVPTNDAEMRQMQSDTEKDRTALGTDARARFAILAEGLNLPSLNARLSVAARAERIQYVGALALLQQRKQKPRDVAVFHLLREALAFDEYRMSYRLDGSSVSGGSSFADKLVSVTRGLSVLDNHGGLRPDASPALPAYFFSASLYTDALDWMSLASMFPGVKRQSLLPGEASQGLERVFQETHQAWLTLDESKKASLFHQALVQSQAVTRGEVMANLLTRSQLVEDPHVPEQYRHYSQQAIDGELWLRRQRGVLLDAAATGDPASPRLGRLRALARRLALSLPFWGSDDAIKFSYHVSADPALMLKGFESLTWFGAAKYEFKLDKAMANLQPHEAIVIWLPLERTTHVFVVTGKDCHWVMVPVGQAELGRRVRSVRRSIEAVSAELRKAKGHPEGVAYPAEDAYALYKALFAPVADRLADVRHLYAVQLGATGGIPLGLLVTRAPAADREPDWLIDRFAITRVPALVNAAALRHSLPSNLPAELLLAAGDPVVAGKTPPPPHPALASLRSVSHIDQSLEPLPETRREMASVASLLGLSPQQARQCVLGGEQATPRRVLDRLRQSHFRYLLFATHGLARFEDIGEPALVLSPDSGKRRPEDDGLLRASDIVGLDLDTDLVILSACETSPSGEDGAEPLTGLASAFLVAGARSVVSTQWPVVTDAAEAVSTAVIGSVRSGREPAVALQEALRHLRGATSSGRPSHPAFWAPYELVAFPR